MDANAGVTCFEHLEVIHDPTPRGAAVNMALDEVLLARLQGWPLLRIYRWSHQACSFGYFEPVAAVRQQSGEREIVRRWTGGGIVMHDADLTYSLLLPRSSSLTNTRAEHSYAFIHAAVARALARLGWQAQSHTGPVGDDESHACFERPVRHDLMAAGQKIAGAAQRRTRAGLLHQGSILLGAGEGNAPDWQDAMVALLPQSLGDHIMPPVVSPEEICLAETLATNKYATSAWTEKF